MTMIGTIAHIKYADGDLYQRWAQAYPSAAAALRSLNLAAELSHLQDVRKRNRLIPRIIDMNQWQRNRLAELLKLERMHLRINGRGLVCV